MKIEHLTSLEFLNDDFTYKGKSYGYDQIDAISFEATQIRHSVNFIPTGSSYESNLELHLTNGGGKLRIGQEWAILGKSQKARMEAVWRAKEVFSELTFNKRIMKYEEQLATKGFFSYGCYQFHKNGDVFRDGKRLFVITDKDITVSVGPFQIYFVRRKSALQKLAATFVNLDEIIDISRDRDCFLYMYRRAYNVYWPNEHYRTRREPPKTIFFKAILTLGARVCSADGDVGREELAAFRNHFQLTSEIFPEAAAVFNEALRSKEGPEAIAKRVKAEATDNRELLEYVLIGLATMAVADGKYEASEHAVLVAVASGFGFNSADLEHILALVGIRPVFGQKGQDDYTKSSAEEEHHLAVLGLELGVMLSEIRTAYRKLARQHHPDHLQACGVPLDKIKYSEEILKTINNSYGWLMKRRNAV